MGNLLTRLLSPYDDLSRMTVDEYNEWALNAFQFGGLFYTGLRQTLAGDPADPIAREFAAYATSAFGDNSAVFSVMGVRQLIFSSVRFTWQRMRKGRPSDTFSNDNLAVLETPFPGGTTQDLLNRAIQDADLAGNAFHTRIEDEIVRLRPDWVEIVLEDRIFNDRIVGRKLAGYQYTEGGKFSGNEPAVFLPHEVSHFAPHPDPLASYRGMSWITPIVREIEADKMMTRHRRRFFEHGATPNMVIKHEVGANEEKVRRWAEKMHEKYGGLDNAYKTLHLYPGADATVVGKDFRQIDFKQVQGAGETRIAMAGGVPPIIVGMSEGLASATYSNYGQARRRLADGTAHPLWQNLAGSFAVLLPSPGRDARLWYDATDVPFLREDEKDAAEIQSTQAQIIRQLIDAGFTAESVRAAVIARDWNLLVHTGLFSVQLQPPGTGQAPADQTLTTNDPRMAAQMIERGWRRIEGG